MFGLKKKQKERVVENHLNQWTLRGRVSRLSRGKHGSSFVVSTMKRLISDEEKLIHHQVQLNSMLTDEYFHEIEEGMTVQVVGEMFYGSKPYNLAKSVEILC